VIIASLIGFLLVVVCHGRIQRLANIRLRHEGWLLTMLFLYSLAGLLTRLQHVPPGLVRGAWLLCALMLGIVALLNGRWWGVGLAGLGVLSNVLVTAVNGGMPVDTTTLQSGGAPVLVQTPSAALDALHVVVIAPKLAFLGDIYRIDLWGVGTFAASVGDAMLVLGVVHFIVSASLDDSLGAPSAHE
jgi:hypothetical protein